MSAGADVLQRSGSDPYQLGHGSRAGDRGREDSGGGPPRDRSGGESGPAPKRIVVSYGFWIFILSDIVMFSAFFAAYTVLSNATAGGPTGRELFDLNGVKIETALLLASSFTCGLAAVAVKAESVLRTQLWLLLTGLLGLGFLLLEVREFSELIARGAGPDRSAFLSGFFALVGCHGAHVTVGLLWLGTMMAQLQVKGFRPDFLRRLLCFSLFWHALDIIWVAILTNVYLMGTV